MYYTSHMEFVEIVGSPMFLHIKVKDRAKRGNGMKISTKFVFNGVEYILKSSTPLILAIFILHS